ncbi:putative ribonuclease H domain-containing protein [Arabidopsis thaliana]
MHIDPIRPKCRNGDETINHALFTCPFSTMTWRLSNTRVFYGHTRSDDLEANIAKLIDGFQSPSSTYEHKVLPFWILWRMWNNLGFNNYRESCSKVVLKAQAETKKWIFSNGTTDSSRKSTSTLPREILHWSKPKIPYVKCNFDASFDETSSQARRGWIIRDKDGMAKAWRSSDPNGATSPLIAETKALLVAMQQTWIRGCRLVIFEGDNEVRIKSIQGYTTHSNITNKDIWFWRKKFRHVLFKFVKRECNNVAHHLAILAYSQLLFLADYVILPIWLMNFYVLTIQINSISF